MPDPQQIMKLKALHTPCETYNCMKKAGYAIGRPDGPMQLWSYFCPDCMRSIIESIPAELMPETEDQLTLVKGYVAMAPDLAQQIADQLPEGEIKGCLLQGIEWAAESVQEGVEVKVGQPLPADTGAMMDLFETFWSNASEADKTVMIEKLFAILDIPEDTEPTPATQEDLAAAREDITGATDTAKGTEQPDPAPKKTYTCKHCGQDGFTSPGDVGRHARNCPAKKAGDGK